MMSSRKLKIIEKKDFVTRFVEIFGTSEASEISRMLDISYQAARNYLEGDRLPDSYVLLQIAEKTPYSIHWLLTGRGEKIADQTENADEKLLLDKIADAAKQGCLTALRESLGAHTETGSKTVVLKNTKVRSEKAREDLNSPAITEE